MNNAPKITLLKAAGLWAKSSVKGGLSGDPDRLGGEAVLQALRDKDRRPALIVHPR